MTLKELYRECSRLIGGASETPALDARIIVQDALGLDGGAFMLQGSCEVPSSQTQRILEMARRRKEGTPVAYITGHRGFFMDDFLVNENTLIPRADTEALVEHAISKSRSIITSKTDIDGHSPKDGPSFKILDLCCGTGCIGISIAKALCEKDPFASVELTLSDISEEAAKVCTCNASNILSPLLDRGAGIVRWNVVVGNLFSTVGENLFDLIATNPPYIQSAVIETLDAQVQREPMLALDGGENGLCIIGRIVEDAPRHLKDGGWMLMEIGFDQGAAVKRLFEDAGFANVSVEKDLGGRDRVVMGRISR